MSIQASSAQPIELILQPEENSSLGTRLQEGHTAKNTGDSLFAEVEAISSVYSHSADLQKPGRKGSPVQVQAYRLGVADSVALDRLLARLKGHPDVRFAHPNYEFRVHGAPSSISSTGSDPILDSGNVLADSLDHLSVVRAREAWATTTGTSTIQIGVIDTGFYLNHPDLQGQFWINDAEDANGNGRFDPYPASEGGDLNGTDDDDNGYVDDVIGYDFVDRSAPIADGEFRNRDPDPSADPNVSFSWHGTAVAGVAAAAPGSSEEGIAGVAPDTRLVALRAFGGDGRGRSDDIAAAISYAATQGVDVLNLSFGRDRAVPLIEDAIEYANEQGTVVVASAGNDLTDDPHYPSDYPDVLSVVWLGEDGELPQFNRSQFGIGVDLGAPGTNVFTADFPAEKIKEDENPSQNDLYRSPNGSSFSAPQVAGAAALLRSVDSSLSPASIRSILTASATDIEGANWDHKTGAGLLDVQRSLMRAYSARTEIDRPQHNQGIPGQSPLPIVGSAVDPSFESYALYYAEGTTDFDTRPDPWVEITPSRHRQVLRDTLGVWPTRDLPEGAYTLRLVTQLRDGRTIEDRRRVRIDSTSPTIQLHFVGTGRVEGKTGILADVETDDVTRLQLHVEKNGQTDTVQSEHTARRHGLSWADQRGTGGEVGVRIQATNATGLSTTVDTTLLVPKGRENTALLRRTRTDLPRGRLLPKAVDFDGDGLQEVLMNRFVEGGVSDTLRSFEWNGAELVSADTLAIGPFLPKDVGDTNGDGLRELLLQVNTATLLLEQPSPDTFPSDLIFADTSRISDAPGDTLNGTRLTDLDEDGQGEVLGPYQRSWRVVERKSAGFEQVAQLENPTEIGPDSAQGNVFDFPEAQTGDFDGDGKRGFLVGDRDGDLIIYEARGDDDYAVAWTHETDRVNAGTRFAAGPFGGEAATNFVTMTTNPPGTQPDGTTAPPISYYSVWTSTGNDAYERVFRLPIKGPFTTDGALDTADLDADGRPEVVVAHPPSLLVLDQTSGGEWRVLFEDRPASILSRSLLTADISGNGTPSVFAGTNDGGLVRYVTDEEAVALAPPRWVRAQPAGDSVSALEWRAAGADSVRVYAGPVANDLSVLTTTTDSATTVEGPSPRRFVLQAWQDGISSPLSEGRFIRPHPPASIRNVSYPSSSTVRLVFTEALAPDLRPEQFQFGDSQTPPERLTSVRNGTGVALHFSKDVTGQAGPLSWTGVKDTTGLVAGQTSVEVSFPTADQRTLFVEEATILDEHRLRLSFNKPLAPEAAQEVDRYDVEPRGRVVEVQTDGEPSPSVLLQMEGLVIGATGQEASLTVTDMVGANGSLLAEEGHTVRLTKPADDLANVYVYPNPYRAGQHGENLTIGGLPTQATVRIYTPSGRLVQVLDVTNNRDGGHRWDLRDRRGERVPSGVYLFRINAPEQSPVLEKAAVIR